MQSDTLVVFTRNGMGHGPPDLQRTLASKWLELCLQNDRLPGAVAFYTDGVRLACEGSPVLDQLSRFEAAGVRLVLCKTCLDAFALTDQVRVGIVGGMGDILAAQTKAAKVVHL